MTNVEAKRELGAVIAHWCKRRRRLCQCHAWHWVHILKQKVPLWLAQHPDVMAYH